MGVFFTDEIFAYSESFVPLSTPKFSHLPQIYSSILFIILICIEILHVVSGMVK